MSAVLHQRLVVLASSRGANGSFYGLNNQAIVGAADGSWELMPNGTKPAVILPASATQGLWLYNTADQTTNYERLEMLWSGNVATLRTTWGGTGGARNLDLFAGNTGLRIIATAGSTSFVFNGGSTSSAVNIATFLRTNSATSGQVCGIAIQPTYNQTSGTAANTDLLINRTETAVGSGAQLLIDAQVGGVSRFSVQNTGDVVIAAGGGFRFSGRSTITSAGDGVLALRNANGTDFSRLQFGGTTSSFPALKRNGGALQVRFADDSDFTVLEALRYGLVDGVAAPSATVGQAKLYVDAADGDLKIIFGDGTVKTIVTDT